MTIRSQQFDDIYFSPEDGLAETHHVFLAGNNLPQAWQGRPDFVIAETGFGTGLNFLTAWQSFLATTKPDQHLHYISFEKYPLSWAQIEEALAPWRGVFAPQLQRLAAAYPLRVPGFHRVVLDGRVSLTLIFDDVNHALPELDVPCGIDAWFLDGFAPAKNPDMWSDTLFTNMARLGKAGTSFATFTAAGAVRRGLGEAGFVVEKVAGYGRKREMLRGVLSPECVAGAAVACDALHDGDAPSASSEREAAARINAQAHARPGVRRNRRVAIVGGGLAGTAAAYVLRRAGHVPVIFEQADRLAPGASGNILGLFNPRLSAHRTADSDFYTAAWAQLVRTVKDWPGIDFTMCGSFYPALDDDKGRKLQGALAHWGWHADHMRWLTADEAAAVSGVNTGYDGLYLPDAGTVNPHALCHAYADSVETRLNVSADMLAAALPDFDDVVWAGGAAVRAQDGFEKLPLHTVRGQVTYIAPTATTQALRVNLCHGGYLAPARGGTQVLGATFQQWRDDLDVTAADHQENLARLAALVPDAAQAVVTGGRTALRASSRDRLPLIGAAPAPAAWDGGAHGEAAHDCVLDNVYLSTAHGSHGIISSLTAAHMIADMIGNGPRSVTRATLTRLSPARFPLRARRKAS